MQLVCCYCKVRNVFQGWGAFQIFALDFKVANLGDKCSQVKMNLLKVGNLAKI